MKHFSSPLALLFLSIFVPTLADEKPTLYDRNKRMMESQGQYSGDYRGYSRHDYHQGRDYFYNDYHSGRPRQTVGRPPDPPQP